MKVKQHHLPANQPRKRPRRLSRRWFRYSVERLPVRVAARAFASVARTERSSHIARSELAALGFDVFQRRPDHHYVHQYWGRSSPKLRSPLEDREFMEIADEVRGHGRTATYYDRFYTLYQALRNVAARLAPEDRLTILEAGVYRGGSSYFLARVAEQLAPGRVEMFSVDTFEGHDARDFAEGVDEGRQEVGTFSRTSYEDVARYLARFPFVTVIKGRIQDVVSRIEGRAFDFVHLDMDLYAPTAFALPWVADRLKPAGIVVMDDYDFKTGPGEGVAVDEFWDKRSRDFSRIVLQTGQCCLIHHPTDAA